MSDPAAASPTFTAPQIVGDQTLTFELKVTDDLGAQDTDEVTVGVYGESDSWAYRLPDGDGEGPCFVGTLDQDLGNVVSLLLGLVAALVSFGVGRGRRS